MERFYEISYRDTPSISLPTEVLPFVPMQPDEKDAIDISGDAFDFVRSIRVRQIQVGKCENREGDCNRSDSTGLGSYGAHGDYRWAPSDVDQVPPASQMAFRTAALTGPCPCNTAPESVHTTTEKKRRQTVKPDALLE